MIKRLTIGLLAIVVLSPSTSICDSGPPYQSSSTIRDVDTNHDGSVDFTDFLGFAGSYNGRVADQASRAAFDHDSDGIIGFGDFLIFITYYGQTYEFAQMISVATLIPDTVRVGQLAEFAVTITNLDPPRGCDTAIFSTDVQPAGTSYEISDRTQDAYQDTVLRSLRVKFNDPGVYQLLHTYTRCVPSVSDTLTIVVLPEN